MLTLRVVKGVEPGRTYEFESLPVVVGRDRGCDLVLVDNAVSRRHALFTEEGGLTHLKDLDSSNGTYVNRERLEPHVELSRGDKVRIGGTVFEVVDLTARPQPPAVDFLDELESSSTTVFQGMVEVERSRFTDLDLSGLDAPRLRARLDAVYRVSQLVGAGGQTSIATTLDGILEVLFETLNVDRAVVLLRDPATEELRPEAARHRDPSAAGEVGLSRSILEQAFGERSAILSADLESDERVDAQGSSVLRGMRSAICAPLLRGEEVLGVLHVDAIGGEHTFDNEELEFVTAIANEMALALHHARAAGDSLNRARAQATRHALAEIVRFVDGATATVLEAAPRLEGAFRSRDADTILAAWERMRAGLGQLRGAADDLRALVEARPPETRPLAPTQLLEAIRPGLEPMADEAGILLDLDPGTDADPVDADPAALARVLLALCRNSLEAMGERGGTLAVRIEPPRVDGCLRVAVEDSGPGIPAELADRVFEASCTTKAGRGLGLGLAIARGLVQAHGGTLEHEPRTDGGGTRFEVTLPRRSMRDAERTFAPRPAATAPTGGAARDPAPAAMMASRGDDTGPRT